MFLAVNAILCSFETIFDNSEKGAAVPFMEQQWVWWKLLTPTYAGFSFTLIAISLPGWAAQGLLNSCAQQPGLETVPPAVLAAVIQFSMGCITLATGCSRIRWVISLCCNLSNLPFPQASLHGYWKPGLLQFSSQRLMGQISILLLWLSYCSWCDTDLELEVLHKT